MHKWNLFKRIERYEGENYATEILAFILDSDDGVREAFLGLIPKRRPDLRKTFRSCVIETQQSFGSARPDMTISPASGHGAKLFVEIKTQAHVPETRSPNGDGQIKRYLEHGHVAYLTPRGHPGPDLGGAKPGKYKYLGQFYWDQVYSAIRNRRSNNVLRKQFLEYLEARRMAPLKPISERDLKDSLRTAEIIRKFRELVDAVRREIEPVWRDEYEFGENTGAKGALSGVGKGYLPYWWFRGSRWKKRGRVTYLCIGVSAEEGERGQPCFYAGLCTDQKKFGAKLEADEKLWKHCSQFRWDWDPDGPPEYWGYFKTFPLGAGEIEDAAKEQAGNLRSEGKNIRKLVERVEKM